LATALLQVYHDEKSSISIVTSLLVYRLDHEEGMLLCAPVGLILTVLPKSDAAFVTCKILLFRTPDANITRRKIKKTSDNNELFSMLFFFNIHIYKMYGAVA
jgi:hypothetical protein